LRALPPSWMQARRSPQQSLGRATHGPWRYTDGSRARSVKRRFPRIMPRQKSGLVLSEKRRTRWHNDRARPGSHRPSLRRRAAPSPIDARTPHRCPRSPARGGSRRHPPRGSCRREG
jgi:hypothetical protein